MIANTITKVYYSIRSYYHRMLYAKNFIASFAAFLSIICCYSQAESSEFSVKPSIILREEYDDNIFLTKDDRRDDYITKILPSLHIDYKTPFWDLTSDYTLNWWYYANLNQAKDSHNLKLESKAGIIKNLLYLDLSDIYSSVVLNPRRPSTDINLDINRSDSNNAVLSPYLKYQLTQQSSLSTGYRYTNIWYRKGTAVNRQTHTGFATFEYIFNPKLKTSLSAEYTYDRPQNSLLDKSNNQTAGFFRAIYTLNPRTNLDGTLGYRWVHFSNGRKEHIPIYSALLTYRFQETGRVELSASSTFSPSPELGSMESKTGQLAIIYGKPLVIKSSIFYRRDKYIEKDQQDNAVGITLGIEYKPQPRLTYRVSGRYEKDKFLPENRKRDIYGGAGEIAYLLTNKSSISLSYNYTRQNGHTESDYYLDNVIAIQTNITF
jgi:hypothetical protein